jgi:hypothetical protein
MAKEIKVTQSGNSFRLEFVSGKMRTVLVSDEDGPEGVRWWLDAARYNLSETLTAFGCKQSQLDEIREKLAANADVHEIVELPV